MKIKDMNKKQIERVKRFNCVVGIHCDDGCPLHIINRVVLSTHYSGCISLILKDGKKKEVKDFNVDLRRVRGRK